MIITAYYPEIFVQDLDVALARYEEMGFTRRHTLDYGYFKAYVMDVDGYRVDIYTSDQEEFRAKDGFVSMRVNVKDFEQALDYYQGLGYKVTVGPIEERSFLLSVLDDEQGNRVFLFHHIETSFSFSD